MRPGLGKMQALCALASLQQNHRKSRLDIVGRIYVHGDPQYSARVSVVVSAAPTNESKELIC